MMIGIGNVQFDKMYNTNAVAFSMRRLEELGCLAVQARTVGFKNIVAVEKCKTVRLQSK
jgi:hypothetical protein